MIGWLLKKAAEKGKEDPVGLRQEVNLQQEVHSNGDPHTSDLQHGRTGAVGGTSWNYFSEKLAREDTVAELHPLALPSSYEPSVRACCTPVCGRH